ncbi:MAG: hypothetical protein RLZ50_1532, partial [Bacteroidota bacterium]
FAEKNLFDQKITSIQKNQRPRQNIDWQ